MKPSHALATAIALAACAAATHAQTIKIAVLQELSGAGATAGTNAKNGVELAVKEINAAGDILGKKIETMVADTQSNPGVAKGLATKAVDDGVFAVIGPTFSGSVLVSMAETKRAEVPNFTGGEAASITQQGNPYIFRTVDAPNPLMLKFKAKFFQEYKYISDHNGIKGYTGVYLLKAGIEKAGKLDRVAVAKALHGLSISAAKEPGVLMDVSIDANGDLDRESYIVEVKNGRQEVKETLPALAKK